MDIPLIRKFACGYVQGAKAVNSKVEVYQNMTGTTPAAWNDPAKGSELAKSQFDRGADVFTPLLEVLEQEYIKPLQTQANWQ